MATRKRLTGAKNKQNDKPRRRCKECNHSYDWHSKAKDGHLILCRCPFQQEGGKFCIFLRDYACEKFEERTQQQEGGLNNG